jgi:diacylglycerol kinase (ATP)
MYCIIFNPTAGAGRSVKTMQKVEEHLKNNNVDYIIMETKYRGHAIELAKDSIGKGYSGILSVGGDGTLLEVAQGLQSTDEILGVIPAGTGNDFREAIGVPADPIGALDIILAGNNKRIDMGLINGKSYFLNVAGTGFDVEVVKNTNKVRRFFTGSIAYYLGIVMSTLKYKPLRLKITLDGKTMERTVLLIAVANGRCFGGGIRVSPCSDVQDGLFNIVILNQVARRRILIELPKLQRGELEKIDVAEQFTCREVTIECEKKQTFNVDGELYGETPSTFSIVPDSISVFCPDNIA